MLEIIIAHADSFTFAPLFLPDQRERKDDERLITRVLQRETNRARLAVCPPPESKQLVVSTGGRWTECQ